MKITHLKALREFNEVANLRLPSTKVELVRWPYSYKFALWDCGVGKIELSIYTCIPNLTYDFNTITCDNCCGELSYEHHYKFSFIGRFCSKHCAKSLLGVNII